MTFCVARQVARLVLVVLQDEMDQAFAAGAGTHGRAQRLDDVGLRVVADGVDGVEAQAVEMELLQPVERVVDEEVAHDLAARGVEVDRRAPRRGVARVEEGRRIGVQVVALRAEVVVDDVEQHHEAARVRLLHQHLEVLGAAVGGVRREGQHAVVAPVAPAGEVGHRHQLEGGDAEFGEVVEAAADAVIVAAAGEAAGVQFVDHRLFPAPPAPGVVAPGEGLRVDDFAGAVDVVGIEARGRVGHAQVAVDEVAVARAGAGCVEPCLVPAVVAAGERNPLAVQFDVDLAGGRGPEAEARGAVLDLRAEGHVVPPYHGD